LIFMPSHCLMQLIFSLWNYFLSSSFSLLSVSPREHNTWTEAVIRPSLSANKGQSRA
jgi:hypothetical protein